MRERFNVSFFHNLTLLLLKSKFRKKSSDLNTQHYLSSDVLHNNHFKTVVEDIIFIRALQQMDRLTYFFGIRVKNPFNYMNLIVPMKKLERRVK